MKTYSTCKEIPEEFITKGAKLQGKIIGIELIEPLCPKKQKLQQSKNFKVVRFKIVHIPILNPQIFKWRANRLEIQSLNSHEVESLKVEMVGVLSTNHGIECLKQFIRDSCVWFKLYGLDKEKNILHGSIITKMVGF